ncbi:MAG TPA: hypothetical protein VL137_07070 [Polyangiaceae bacterium]|nr:hypothetical protein [Polyangiaceae bacterium]
MSEPVAPVAATEPAAIEPPGLVHTERQALFMAAVVFMVTLACWGGAEFACNKHPPEFKEPKPLAKAQLTTTAKDTAIELQQRDLSGDVSGALELADGALKEQLTARQAQCGAAHNCGGGKPVLTQAEVLRYEGTVVVIRTISQQDGKETRAQVKVERRDAQWKAIDRAPE